MEVAVGLDGMSFAHPLPLCPLLPLSGGRGARPLDVEMPEAVMKNGNKRIQTKVRLRGDMEDGGDQRIHTQVMRAVRLEGGEGKERERGGGLHGEAEEGRPIIFMLHIKPLEP